MNEPRPDRPDHPVVRQLVEVLRLRQGEAPTPARAGVLEELAADEPLQLVEAVERSSLGAPEARALRLATPPDMIADVLAAAARVSAVGLDADATDPVHTLAVPVDGAIRDWLRETRRLVESRSNELEKTLEELVGLGFSLTVDGLEDVLTAVPVCPDRELVRSIVTVLGGDWSGRAYEASYDAALDEQRKLEGRLDATSVRRDTSGLTGADWLTPQTLLRHLQPHYELLPAVVRGRDALVRLLVGDLDREARRVRVLVGAGGCGKSTVALAVAAAARDRGLHVWWVTASDPNQVRRGMLAVATQLGAPVSELNAIQSTPDIGARQLWRRMDASAARWLLVFDDADSPGLFDVPGEDLLDEDACHGLSWLRPSSAGTVLVTSRAVDSERWGPIADLVEVPDLAAEAGALALLDRCTADAAAVAPPQRAEAVSVVEHLGGVALAVDTVGTFLASDTARSDVTHLLAELRAGRHADPRRIGVAWDVVTAALDARGLPEARTLLRVLACYAPQWVIPLEVLAPERLAQAELPTAADGTDALAVWERALAGLLDVGLISKRHTAGEQVEGVVVHRLVAETARAEADPYDERVLAGAVRVLRQESKQLGWGRPADWPALRRLEPHVYALLDNLGPDAGAAVRSKALRVANNIAAGLIRGGLFSLGEALIRHALACTGELGAETSESLSAEHTLAWALGLRGELAEAERRFRALVRVERRLYGLEARATLRDRRHLAWVLAEQGRIEDAQHRLCDLLPATERVLGPDHRETLSVRHHIAWITALRGRPDEAERLFVELLPRRIAAFGADHMEVLSTRYRLAWSRGLQGRCAEAEADFEALLADIESVFAPDSPSVVMVRSRLGWVRAWQGRFDDAEKDHRFVLEARERVLGSRHPRTLWARYHLATLLLRRGDHRGAERLLREVIAEAERGLELGRDHPLSMEGRDRLARLLADSGRLEEAERTGRALVTQRRRVTGPDHPATLRARYVVALAILRSGRLREAEVRLQAVVADQERVLGFDDRHTLETRAALAEVYGRAGRLTESLAVGLDTLKSRLARLGPDHPDVLDSRGHLVWVLGEMHAFDEAFDRCRDLIDDRARIFGAMHPETLSARYRYGWLCALANRGEEAMQAFRELALDQHRVLGREHPATLRTRHGLAHEMLRAHQYEEAELALRSVLLDRVHILGQRHPDTLTNRHSLAFARALQGELDEAERSMQAVLLQQLDVLGAEHRQTLLTRERLAWIQAKQRRLHDAAEHWRHLHRDRQRLFGPDHPDTVRCRQRLDTIGFEVPELW
jgi:tetratricopeptide (TPR) repeat protein